MMLAGSLPAAPVVPELVWPVACGVAVVAFALVWLRRRSGQNTGPPAELWQAVGRPCPEFEGAEHAWQAMYDEVQRLRETTRRVHTLQLRTTAIEAEFALVREVLQSMQDGIVVLDRSERILYSNRTAQRILGIDDHGTPGLEQAQSSLEIVDGIRSVLSADLARHVKRRQVEWVDDDQKRSYVIRCLVPPHESPAQAMDSCIVVLEDHTAEDMASRAKTEFIYGISHELKTPLTSIQASLELLVDEPGLSAEERDKLSRMSLAEAVRLGRMVRELLDLARVEAGITQFTREKVGMDEMLDGLKDLHQPLADRDEIELSWEVSDYLPTIQGDPRLLRQAFVNLIGNAVKYTKRDGTVALTAGLQGTELVVRIRDTGIGIATEDLPRIFDKFYRAGSAETSLVQGTGLGLPMARYIIERHHGRIEVTSVIDQGTEFTVFLPAGTFDVDSDAESTLMTMDGVMG